MIIKIGKNTKEDFYEMVDGIVEQLHANCRMGVNEGVFTADEYWSYVDAKSNEMKVKFEEMSEPEFIMFLFETLMKLVEKNGDEE